MIFYNGFNLLVDMVAVMATMFITYRYAIRRGFWRGVEFTNELTEDEHWQGVIHE
jgi:hypothetical protein